MADKQPYKTIPTDKMEEIRTFVKERWNYPYLGRGMADRMQSIHDSYAKQLDEAGLKVIFVPKGNDTIWSTIFTGRKGYHKIVKKEVTA